MEEYNLYLKYENLAVFNSFTNQKMFMVDILTSQHTASRS